MRRPVDEAFIQEAPGGPFRVDFHEHVRIGIITCGGHDVVLRAIDAAIVDPLVLVAGDD